VGAKGRVTRTAAIVSSIFLLNPGRTWYGYELMKEGGVGASTLYPLLRRWAAQGWIESVYEDQKDGPVRRHFKMTSLGAAEFAEMRRRSPLFAKLAIT
jgi:DNA-binding PadR family transcriptional regulator